MNIQAEKIELIRLMTETDSEQVLKKIKGILAKAKSGAGNTITPIMEKRLLESKKQINEGSGATITFDEIWKWSWPRMH